jgi:hypothetical protein
VINLRSTVRASTEPVPTPRIIAVFGGSRSLTVDEAACFDAVQA